MDRNLLIGKRISSIHEPGLGCMEIHFSDGSFLSIGIERGEGVFDVAELSVEFTPPVRGKDEVYPSFDAWYDALWKKYPTSAIYFQRDKKTNCLHAFHEDGEAVGIFYHMNENSSSYGLIYN